MSKKATKKAATKRREPASDRRIVLGALGGYVAHKEYRVLCCHMLSDGSIGATVGITIPAASVARAREESSTGAGGWGTGWRE